MNIVFMGTPDFSVPCLNVLIENGENISAVFTQPDKPRGRRGSKLLPSPVKECALQHNIPVYSPKSLKSGEDAETSLKLLREIAPDLIVVVAYGKILPRAILDLPKYNCINIHASLLPRYRGAAPIQRCVLNGEKETGITSMLMSDGIDTGDMLIQRSTPIGENETASELWDRLSVMGAEVLIETINAVKDNSLQRMPQDDSLSCYSPVITKDMCGIDFSESAETVHHKILGLSSSPCANTYINGKRLKIYHSVLSHKHSDMAQGSVISDKELTVVCGDGNCVTFTEVQTDGGKRMKAADFLRGNPVKAGTVLSSDG